MKTSKQVSSDLSSSRRAQPLRQTRNNPPRSSISGARPFGSRASLSGDPIDIFPAITHFADAITALPKELVRHFTLLKEVDAKIFAPEEELGKLVDAALQAPLSKRPQASEAHHALGPTSAPMSAQGSLNGSIINSHAESANSVLESGDAYNSNMAWDPANVPRRQLFQHCAYTMSNMLVSLDEKNHVIATAAEALNKQLARIDDCFPYIEFEISEEARYGSTTHWAYPENRVPKTGAVSRREIAAANNLSAAAQHLVDEAAARSDARKQALLERKKGKTQHVDSDFDDNQDNRQKDKKLHGNSKVRKAVDTSVGLGITNGATTNGNPPKRQKVNNNKASTGGAGMERSLSSVFASNGTGSKGKTGSPRETPVPEGSKKRSRAAAGTGQTRKSRNNTVTSAALSPSLASSPIRNTFPETKPPGTGTPPPTNGRPASVRARQNSTQSIIEKRAPSEVASKQNGNGTPDLGTAATITGRSVPEVKVTMKETGPNSKGEHLLEDANQDNPDMVGGLVVGSRKGSTTTKQEEPESNGDSMQDIQTTTITTTKSGRASKPSTPAIPSFPETVRSRSSRALETTSINKRSHKKGAGAAAQLIAQQIQTDDGDDAASNMNDEDVEEEIAEDEPTYCYCNGVSYGEMVGCDAPGCEREWFHLECVGLKVAPKGNAKWYCDDCIKKRPNQKRR
ncbi:hypothetical protein EG329_000418 [Mollisiaceae sp. DMI_Dod_QoI]|nr:hypothetical protein EG329_000418 [Helotiales sp. DMI_Dod_QoI]